MMPEADREGAAHWSARIRRLVWALLLFASAAGAATPGEVAEQVRDWFLNDYGSHWHDARTIEPEVLSRYYVDEYRVLHLEGGSEVISNSAQWWRDFLASDPEWLGSSNHRVRVVALTSRTAAISAEWLSRYAGGETRSECNAYVVARTTSGPWQCPVEQSVIPDEPFEGGPAPRRQSGW